MKNLFKQHDTKPVVYRYREGGILYRREGILMVDDVKFRILSFNRRETIHSSSFNNNVLEENVVSLAISDKNSEFHFVYLHPDYE